MSDEALRIINRAQRYSSEVAAIGAAGVVETLTNPPSRGDEIHFWLVTLDLGYRAGLAAYAGFLAAIFFQLWWLAAPLLVIAFTLCWWFG